MKANELRIKNLVKSNLTGCVFSVTAEDIMNVCIDDSVIDFISLTKEWLLKFGFVPEDKYPFLWYDKDKISISFIENRMCQELEYSYNQFKIPKYVHQLQNLYFDLTGEELVMA